jgi:hypothetical protein
MKTTRGEIYFVRELETGLFSPFTKIGLISYDKDRSSSDRLPEHQTGNPRKLVISHYVVTDCVNAVETYMHRKYASLRGLGEWFRFDEALLAEAISFCEQLASRFAGEVAVLELSKTLKDSTSDGVVVEPSDEAKQWLKKYVVSGSLIDECDNLQAMYEELIREAESTGVDTSRNADFRTSERSGFNEKGFKEKYEELWTKYALSVTTISGRFMPEKIGKGDAEIVSDLPDFVSLRDRFSQIFNGTEHHSSKLELLKDCYLELLGFSKEATVEKEIAEAHLKVLCGTSDGITGICKWKRAEKTSFALDKKSLEANHPSEFKEFQVTKTIESLVKEKAQGVLDS